MVEAGLASLRPAEGREMMLPGEDAYIGFEELRARESARTRQLAFVVMQFASDPWDLYAMVASGLHKSHYFAVRADDVKFRKDPSHIWTLLRECQLVLVDVTNRNVNVYMELGAALAYAESPDHSVPVARIGERTVVEATWRPFDLRNLEIAPYDVTGDREATELSVCNAVATAIEMADGDPGIKSVQKGSIRILTTDRVADERRMLDHLPTEVVQVLRDPAACVLATRYVQSLGKRVDLELAASAGFPELPSSWFTAGGLEPSDDLIHSTDVVGPLPNQLRGRALGAVRSLVDIQRSRDTWVGQSPDVPNMTAVDRRLTFVGALLKKSSARSSAEVEVLASVLSEIAASASLGGAPRPSFWERGLQAVRQFTRIRAVSVAPTVVATIPRIQAAATDAWDALQDYLLAQDLTPQERQHIGLQRQEAEDRRPTHIATLGGAYYLGHSIAAIRRHGSPYCVDAEALAASTLPGQTVTIPGADDDPRMRTRRGRRAAAADATAYVDGLRALGALFSVEHPFHLRVLLELLTGENRRYPAECILTHEALRYVWTDPLYWERFVWYRDQLPVVANFLASTTAAADMPNRAFVQDYAAFGRTPHTSSFMRVDYPSGSTELAPKSWWPAALAAADPLRVANLPKSVADSLAGEARQQQLGRVWRGQPTPADRDRIAGDILSWGGVTGDDRIIDLLQNPLEWPALGFAELVIAEVRVGVWMVDSLAAWVLASDDADIRHQVQHVLRIVARFAAAYLDGTDVDGLPGLEASLGQIERLANPSWTAKLSALQLRLGGLSAELRAALVAAEPSLRHGF